MLIKSRPEKLSNAERNKEKTLRTLQWLLEFRISSIEILSATLGLEPNGASRFFKHLIDQHLIERVKATYCDKRDLVILGYRAATYLEGDTRDFTSDIAKARRMKSKDDLNHHLEVQKAVLRLLPQAMEVISEFNIELEGKRPDALVLIGNSVLAMEMEKTHKSKKTVHLIFQQYLKLISSGHVACVYFFFSKKEDRERYQRYFAEEDWNEAYINTKKKLTKLTGNTIHIAADHWIRKKRVFFFDSPPEEPPRIFKLEEACQPKASYTTSYRERIEEGYLDERAKKSKERREEAEDQAKKERAREERLRLERSRKVRELMSRITESEKQDAEQRAKLWASGSYVSETPKLRGELDALLSVVLPV